MTILDILASEAVLAIAAAGASAVWAAFKTGACLRQARTRRVRRALAALEAAVEQTYHEYVRALKDGRADGRLTPEEQAQARRRACERAIVIAREQGIDLIRELGADFIDLWISRIVRKLKRRIPLLQKPVV